MVLGQPRGKNIVFEQTFKNIDDVLWKEAGCATELDYTEQTSWILFLKYLDDLERANEQRAELHGKKYTFIIDKPHRWSAWAAPKKHDVTFDHDKALTGDDLTVHRLSTNTHQEARVAVAIKSSSDRVRT
jgi:type I restriction enzyme M protein